MFQATLLRQEDLLSNKTDAGTSSQTDGEVRLLQANRIPAGYQKLVRGKVKQDLDSELLLFTPRSLENDVLLPDSEVTLQEDKLVTLVVCNHGRTVVCLLQLGTVNPVDPISMIGERETADKRDSSEETGVEAEGGVLWLDTGQDSPDSRVDKLFKQLELKLNHLTEEEQQMLKSILTSYRDVFTLNSSELGTTDAVMHSIDTGDHRLVRQQVRRSPFALRATIDKLIKEMMSNR